MPHRGKSNKKSGGVTITISKNKPRKNERRGGTTPTEKAKKRRPTKR